jgi:hypothetical protein
VSQSIWQQLFDADLLFRILFKLSVRQNEIDWTGIGLLSPPVDLGVDPTMRDCV